MEVNHMGWKLVMGVKQDVINLFKLFASSNSVRYEDFCEVWKQMKFSLIYSNRTTFIEILEFTEEILQIVKKYILSVYEFNTRVAALYTLYGLYFKQPIKDAAKIRFTLSEWEEFQSLISTCKMEKHYDVVFIHLKLYLSGAYTFTAIMRTVGLEKGFRKYFEKKYSVPSSTYDVDLLYRPLISEKLVESLVKLESLYCKKKSVLLGKNNLVFIDGNFAKSLQDELKNYAAKCQVVSTKLKTENNVTDASTSKEEFEAGGINTVDVSATREVKAETNIMSDVSTPREVKAETIMVDASTSNERREEVETRDACHQTDLEDEIVEESVKCNDMKQFSRKRVSKQLEFVARKKAELYIKKLREETLQQELESQSQSSSFNLPELDFS